MRLCIAETVLEKMGSKHRKEDWRGRVRLQGITVDSCSD